MERVVETTNNFYDAGALSYNVGDEPTNIQEFAESELSHKKLSEVRKETENGAKTRGRKKSSTTKTSTGTKTRTKKSTEEAKSSSNIVENSIGKSNKDVLEALSELKSTSKTKTKTRETKKKDTTSVKEEILVATEENLVPAEEKKDTVKHTEETTAFAEENLNKAEEVEESKEFKESKSEGGVNLTEFFRRVVNLRQLNQCAKLLVNVNFIISHTENQGGALYSELIKSIDRVTGGSYKVLNEVCNQYTLYQESLLKMTEYLANKYSDNAELCNTFKEFTKCMR